MMIGILLLIFGASNAYASSECASTISSHAWDTGASGNVKVTFPSDVTSWSITLTFSEPVTNFQVWVGQNIECSGNTCTFENMSWNSNMNAGDELDIAFLYYFDSASEITNVSIDGLCGGETSGTTTSTTTTTTTGSP